MNYPKGGSKRAREIMRRVEQLKENKIFELFERNIDIEIVTEIYDEFKCKFHIGDDTYFFHARDENKIYPNFIRYGWHITFGIVGPDKYKLTNKNIPFKVLNGVKKCYDIFIKKYHPNRMSFIAEGEKKSILYLNIFGKNYKINKKISGLESYSGEIPYLFMIDELPTKLKI